METTTTKEELYKRMKMALSVRTRTIIDLMEKIPSPEMMKIKKEKKMFPCDDDKMIIIPEEDKFSFSTSVKLRTLLYSSIKDARDELIRLCKKISNNNGDISNETKEEIEKYVKECSEPWSYEGCNLDQAAEKIRNNMINRRFSPKS